MTAIRLRMNQSTMVVNIGMVDGTGAYRGCHIQDGPSLDLVSVSAINVAKTSTSLAK